MGQSAMSFRYAAALRKNGVRTFGRFRISLHKIQIFRETREYYSFDFSENFIRNLISSLRRFQAKIDITFLSNRYFIWGNLATFECSHDVFPQHSSPDVLTVKREAWRMRTHVFSGSPGRHRRVRGPERDRSTTSRGPTY